MSGDQLQGFVEQHPALFASIFPVYFLALWLLVGAVISLVGGWHSLAGRYRAQGPFTGMKRTMQSGRMRWLANYNNVLTLGASQEGLYLACMFLFRFMHPPLLIPWSEITITRSKGLFLEYVTFTMDRELAIPLKIRTPLAEELRMNAGNRWPTEQT
jgi:hypothetical protein